MFLVSGQLACWWPSIVGCRYRAIMCSLVLYLHRSSVRSNYICQQRVLPNAAGGSNIQNLLQSAGRSVLTAGRAQQPQCTTADGVAITRV